MRSEMNVENRMSGTGYLLLILMIGIISTGLFLNSNQIAESNLLPKNPITIIKSLPFGKALINFDHSSLHLIVSNNGKSIEISSQTMTDQNQRYVPAISLHKFNNSDILILSGELTINHRNIRWVIVSNKNN